MGSIVVMVFLLVVGLNFGTQPEGEFYETEVALENGIAGSGSNLFMLVETRLSCQTGQCLYYVICTYGRIFINI
jgi:Rad3-related DNA helicase